MVFALEKLDLFGAYIKFIIRTEKYGKRSKGFYLGW
jgi:hypothetical protein